MTEIIKKKDKTFTQNFIDSVVYPNLTFLFQFIDLFSELNIFLNGFQFKTR